MSHELQQLSAEWRRGFGTDIPRRIEILPLPKIREALEHGRRRLKPVSEMSGSDESMMDFDGWKP